MAGPASDPPKRNPGDSLVVAGALLLAVAAGLWSVPAGLAVLGVELVVVGLWWRQ